MPRTAEAVPAEASYAEYSTFKDRPLGGTLTLFVEVQRIQEVYD